jgi:hypothetical protein
VTESERKLEELHSEELGYYYYYYYYYYDEIKEDVMHTGR